MSLGDEVAPSKAISAPRIVLPSVDPNKLYTILMLDFDAPSRENPVAAPWLHWLRANVKGAELSELRGVGRGEDVVDYAGPAPPKGTGLHRYVVLVYEEQEGAIHPEPPTSRRSFQAQRRQFNIKEFKIKNRLADAEGGFFFRSQH